MSVSKLLLDEHPLVIQPALAVAIGLNEAIVLQQVHYWLQRTDNEAEGFKWVYNTYQAWHEQFPFWGYNTVRRTIEKLQTTGLLISGNFNKLKADHTKWYRIDYAALELAISAKPFGNSANPSAQNGQANSPDWAGELPKVGRAIPETTPETTTKTTEELTSSPLGVPERQGRSATSDDEEDLPLQANSFSKFDDPRYTHELRANDEAYARGFLFKTMDCQLQDGDIPHLARMIATYGKRNCLQLFRDMREANRGFKPSDFIPDGFEEFVNGLGPDDFPYPISQPPQVVAKAPDPKQEEYNRQNREARELIRHFEATHDRHVKRINGGNIPAQQLKAAKGIIADHGGLEAAKQAVKALADDSVGVRNLVSLRKRLMVIGEAV